MMKNNEFNLPTSCLALSEEEMMYLVGGCFQTIKVSNYLYIVLGHSPSATVMAVTLKPQVDKLRSLIWF